MANSQSSQKKYKITIAALCGAFLMLVIALVGVWAATSQSISAGFDISYSTTTNVAASVRTEYYVPGQDSDGDGTEDGAITIFTDSKGNKVTSDDGYVVFNATDAKATRSVHIGDVTLTPETPKVEFYFTIKNLLQTNYVQVNPKPNITTQENVNIDFYFYNTANFTTQTSASTISASDFTNSSSDNIAAGAFKIIKIVISVADINSYASCSGDFAFNLEKTNDAETLSVLSKTELHEFAENLDGSYNEELVLDY
ncbi:MAG: hypothetical protein IJY90_03350 [Clostridia bacterium]|nr:hypothetical protein [Clostridia bacterium]